MWQLLGAVIIVVFSYETYTLVMDNRQIILPKMTGNRYKIEI